jgi:hypothetical protein
MTQPITIDQVLSTYNGKAHACCCGCSGTHSYPTDPDLAALAGKRRGYAVEPDEQNDRKMANVIRKINANLSEVEEQPTYWSYETPTRLYVAYKRDHQLTVANTEEDTMAATTKTPTGHTHYISETSRMGIAFDLTTCDHCGCEMLAPNSVHVKLNASQAKQLGYQIRTDSLPDELDVTDDGDAVCSQCAAEAARNGIDLDAPIAAPLTAADIIVRSYVEWIDTETKMNSKTLADWTDSLTSEMAEHKYGMLYYFEWASGAARAAARIDIGSVIIEALTNGKRSPAEAFAFLVKTANREIRRHATTSSSTSPWSNAAACCRAEAWEAKLDELETRLARCSENATQGS